MRARVLMATGLVGAALMSLSACASSGGTPHVASVSDGGGHTTAAGGVPESPSGAGSSSTNGHRPILRVDDSDQRRATLWNAYNTCLLQHGAHKPSKNEIVAAPGGTDRGGHDPGVLVGNPVPAKARAACIQVEPEGPLELDASTNPHFHEQSLAYVACLRRHGEYVRLLNDHDIDWTYIAGHPVPDDNGEFEPKCLVEAFGGK